MSILSQSEFLRVDQRPWWWWWFFCSTMRKWSETVLTAARKNILYLFWKNFNWWRHQLKGNKNEMKLVSFTGEFEILSVPVIRIVFRLETIKLHSSFSRAAWWSWPIYLVTRQVDVFANRASLIRFVFRTFSSHGDNRWQRRK